MPQVSRRLLGRRKVLVALGSVTTAAAAWSLAPATALARYSARRGKRQRIELPGADRFELLGEELRAGTSLGLGGLGIIEAVLPAHHGAVPVVMRTPAGDRFQVDILRRDPRGPGGVATTAQFDLFIANRGDGSARTLTAGHFIVASGGRPRQFPHLPVDGKPTQFDLTEQVRKACSILIDPILKGIHKLVATFDPEFQNRLKNRVLLAGGGFGFSRYGAMGGGISVGTILIIILIQKLIAYNVMPYFT